jgi:hypothetical protein
MKYKKALLGSLMLVVALIAALLATQPLILKSLYARFKSTEHFLVLEKDPRIRYEEGAELNAEKVFSLLSETEEAVAQVLNSSFEEPIRIFVCATQDSFNEYVFLSQNVRGAVYWGNLFLSPGAFERGSLNSLLEHELTHYLFYTHLGERDHIRNVPLWFREGVAVFVDSIGGGSDVENADAFMPMNARDKSTFLSGEADYWFYSSRATDAVTEGGVANAMLYRISGAVVHYLYITDTAGFKNFVQSLLSGANFNDALETTTEYSSESLLQSFREALQSSGN